MVLSKIFRLLKGHENIVTPSFVSLCVGVYVFVFLAFERSTGLSFHPSSFKLYMPVAFVQTRNHFDFQVMRLKFKVPSERMPLSSELLSYYMPEFTFFFR